MKTKVKQWRLSQVAREIGVRYKILHYHVSLGMTPVDRKVAYTVKDVEALRRWAVENGRIEPPDVS